MNDFSTIQSLHAVDAWIDVINANINGGVRTAFKSSRLRMAGTNPNVVRGGTTSVLPLQIPEPSLTTANTVIDFSQGAITTSTETSHLAIQGEGFFVLIRPDGMDASPASATFGRATSPANTTDLFLLTRDGEFHTDQNGFLRAANGYYLVTADVVGNPFIAGQTILFPGFGMRAVFNDLESPANNTKVYVPLSNFLQNGAPIRDAAGGDVTGGGTDPTQAIIKLPRGKQDLVYSHFGSTMFTYAFTTDWATYYNLSPDFTIQLATTADATLLSKSLEASNSSMTQSVPELSLAQKLFSALTKILQTRQTDTDAVINIIR